MTAECSSKGGASVVQAGGRCERCRSIRSAISASQGSAVAMNVTDTPAPAASRTAVADLPLRAPPTSRIEIQSLPLALYPALVKAPHLGVGAGRVSSPAHPL